MGGKQLYYANTYDNKTEDFSDKLKETIQDNQEPEEEIFDACSDGACTL